MKIVDKILLALCGVLAFGLMFYLMIVFDAKDIHSVIASTIDTVGQIVHGVIVGVAILFFACLCMGITYGLVHIHKERSLVRPNKHGAVQAIRHGRQTILLEVPVDHQKRIEDVVALMHSMQKMLPSTNIVESKPYVQDMNLLTQGQAIPKALAFLRCHGLSPQISWYFATPHKALSMERC